jgi:multidrug efflux pump subunit AcrB
MIQRIVDFFVSNTLFTLILTISVFVTGSVALWQMQREAFPEVEFDVTQITTSFPGAGPSEVEELITIPLEREIDDIDGLDELRSVSAENISLINIQLDPDARDTTKINRDIEKAVDRVVNLPEAAEDPIVTPIESSSTPILELSVSGDLPELELRQAAKEITDRLEKVRGVSKIAKNGYRDREMIVELVPEKLQQAFLSIPDVSNALKQRNISLPGGDVARDGQEYLIRTTGEFETAEEIENTVVRANDEGSIIRIRDLGKVKEGLEESNIQLFSEGQRAINLVILKRRDGDAVDLADGIKAEIKTIQKEYEQIGSDISIEINDDFSFYITRRLDVLKGNLLIGIILVTLALLYFLTFRVATVVVIGIPFSFFGAMIILEQVGVTINLISMFALIIVLGMLVDDAVVVCENIYRKIEEGIEIKTAAIQGTIEVFPAITASVLTTCAAFFPILFMTGIIGKFMWGIPIVVFSALGFSLFEALTILPGHMTDFFRKPLTKEQRASKKGSYVTFFNRTYMKVLKFVLRRKYAVIALIFAFFAGTGFLASKMKLILFPAEGIEVFFVRAESEPGTSLDDMARHMKPVEKEIASLPDNVLRTYLTSVGIHQNDPNDPFTKRASHFAQVKVFLTPTQEREEETEEVIERLRERIGVPTNLIDVRFEKVRTGPPVGAPVAIDLRGENYDEILQAAEILKSKLNTIRGVFDVGDSYDMGKPDIRLAVDPVKASSRGLSTEIIASTVRGAFAGQIPTSIVTTEEEIDVRVRFNDEAKESFEAFEKIQVPNNRGLLIPLMDVVSVKESRGPIALLHSESDRVVTVRADVDTDVITSTEANAMLAPSVEKIEENYPKITVEIEGEASDTMESLENLLKAFSYSAFFIFLILVLTFKTLAQPLMILLAIPLGLTSVVWTLFLHQKPVSFMALLGVIGLAGVIVNNAIVLLAFTNQLRSNGYGAKASLLRASKIRFRPIMLTSITTVFGILPTAYGIGGDDPFLKPMALALGWGLALGALLTIFVIPCIQSVVDDINARIRARFSRSS